MFSAATFWGGRGARTSWAQHRSYGLQGLFWVNPGSPLGFSARASGLLRLSAVLLPAVRWTCRRHPCPSCTNTSWLSSAAGLFTCCSSQGDQEEPPCCLTAPSRGPGSNSQLTAQWPCHPLTGETNMMAPPDRGLRVRQPRRSPGILPAHWVGEKGPDTPNTSKNGGRRPGLG